MPVTTTHGVDADEVVALLPYDTTYVEQSDSKPLNLDLVDGWIQRASGIANALLSSRGFDPAGLDADAQETVSAGVEAYARAKCLVKLRADDTEIREARREWEEARDVIRKMPQEIGSKPGATVFSNVDPDDATDKNWDSNSFDGW